MNIDKLVIENKENAPNLIVWDRKKKEKEKKKGKKVNVNKSN